MRLTRFCGNPKPSSEQLTCSEATGLTEPNEECRRTRVEKHSTSSTIVCLASLRVGKQ
jgi:hypothetical protein